MGKVEAVAFGNKLDPKALLLERADRCERGAVVIIEVTRNGSPFDAEPSGSFTCSNSDPI